MPLELTSRRADALAEAGMAPRARVDANAAALAASVAALVQKLSDLTAEQLALVRSLAATNQAHADALLSAMKELLASRPAEPVAAVVPAHLEEWEFVVHRTSSKSGITGITAKQVA